MADTKSAKSRVINAAAEIADKEGLGKVSLKRVAEKLNIKSPSLYNHVASLDELIFQISLQGMREINDALMNAALGRSGDEALIHIGLAYVNYAQERPGVYEAVQFVSRVQNPETKQLLDEYVNLMERVLSVYELKENEQGDVLRILRALSHGLASLASNNVFHDKQSRVNEIAKTAIETLLLGLHEKFDIK